MRRAGTLSLLMLILAGCQSAGPAKTPANARKDAAWDAQRAALKYELASAELRGGSTDKALGLALEAVALGPDRAEHIELLAKVYISRGDFSAAKALLLNSHVQHPEFAGPAYLLGTIFERERDWAAAIDAYGGAVENDPEVLDYRLALAQCVAQAAGSETGLRVLLDSQDRFDSEPLFHVAAAEIAGRGGDFQAACAHYERAVQLGAGEATRVSLGLCEYWRGNGARALEHLEPVVLRATAAEPAVMAAYAGALLQAGKVGQASEWLTRFTVQRPEATDLWLLLAQARSRQEDAAGALEAAERAARLAPDRADVQLAFAALNFAGGNLDAAHAAATRAWRIAPEDSTTLVLLGRIQERQGNCAEARVAYQRAAALDPANDLASALAQRVE